MFPIKFSSESLQICYVDSLYHALYHMGDFKFIYYIIFDVFTVFTLKNMTWENVKVSH